MASWREIPGWFAFARAYDALVAALPADQPSTFVELGLWQGRSSAYLGDRILASGKPITYVGVDSFRWLDSPNNVKPTGFPDDYEPLFRGNLAPVAEALGARFRVLRGDSADSAASFAAESVDVVWIDADHETPAVLRDIDAWWPKLAPNGVMGGDDWAFGSVQAAVRERFNGWAHAANGEPGLAWPWWWVRKGADGKPTPV
jgi:predicted O-methyltransferase YrrM